MQAEPLITQSSMFLDKFWEVHVAEKYSFLRLTSQARREEKQSRERQRKKDRNEKRNERRKVRKGWWNGLRGDLEKGGC